MIGASLDLFTQFTIVVVFASVLGIVARLLRQPAIVGYLAAGILVGLLGRAGFFELTQNTETFEFVSDLGIMFLLFLVGLEMNYAAVRIVRKDAILVGIGQVLFTFVIAFVAAYGMGFSSISAFYIGLALTFSSTVIVVNLLSEKKDLNSLYGKITLGILLIQDIVVVLALVTLTGAGGGVLSIIGIGENLGGGLLVVLQIIATLIVGIMLFVAAFWLGRTAIPLLFEKVARSPDLIFLSGVAWLFLLAMIVDAFNFSREIGGFLAGVTLANSITNLEVAHRMRSLRDFFILIFFVILGSMSVSFADFGGLVWPIIVFSLFVLIGNPLIVFAVMGALGYKRRDFFLTGITIAQISEFSLILVRLGFDLGHITPAVVTLVTGVGVITITLSTYLISHAETLYRVCTPFLGFFERSNAMPRELQKVRFKKPVVIVGFHRLGSSIALHLPREDILVIEHDPAVRGRLSSFGVDYIIGDMNDPEVLEKIDWSYIRVFISTSPDVEGNLLLLQKLKDIRREYSHFFKIVMRARTEREAKILYDHQADYVMLPHFATGRFMARTLTQDPYFLNAASMRAHDLVCMTDQHNAC